MIATKVSHLVPRVFPHNCLLPPLLLPALLATFPETRKWGRGGEGVCTEVARWLLTAIP